VDPNGKLNSIYKDSVKSSDIRNPKENEFPGSSEESAESSSSSRRRGSRQRKRMQMKAKKKRRQKHLRSQKTNGQRVKHEHFCTKTSKRAWWFLFMPKTRMGKQQ
jgi:hypothetical protein